MFQSAPGFGAGGNHATRFPIPVHRPFQSAPGFGAGGNSLILTCCGFVGCEPGIAKREFFLVVLVNVLGKAERKSLAGCSFR